MRLGAALLLMALPAAAAERPKVDIACIPGGGKLVYDCTFVVRDARTGKPVNDVDVVIEAEMMSTERSLPPMRAAATGGPGTYRARLTLAVHGNWTLRLRLSGTVNDVIAERLRFEDGRPAQRR
jgi:hypothetical protein